jgi:hypothetical protein
VSRLNSTPSFSNFALWRVRPNPSLEPTRSGKAPWPPRAQVPCCSGRPGRLASTVGSAQTLGVTSQVRGRVRGIYSKSAHHAARNLPLRCRHCRDTFGSGEGHQLQLLHLPPLGCDLGLLRVRHRPNHRPSREHAGVHPRRQDPRNCALRNVWLRHALGAVASRTRQAPRCQPAELRSKDVGVRANSAFRWRRHLDVPGVNDSDA